MKINKLKILNKINNLANLSTKICAKGSIYFVALIFYAVIFLPMIMEAYFYCDDKILSSSIYTSVSFYHKNFFRICFESFKQFYDSGRFYGLYFTHFIIFYFFHDRLHYYIVKALFNLISVIFFGWFIKLLTKNSANPKAFIFLMPLMFLISLEIDPITSMGLSTQYSIISIALAMGFYILWREKKIKKYEVLSYIFFIWSFFHYEIGICIVPLFIILATRYRLLDSKEDNLNNNFDKLIKYLKASGAVCFKELKWYLLIFFGWVIACIYIQQKSLKLYDGITFNFDIKKITLTWIYQITATFPFGGLNIDLHLSEPENTQILVALFLAIFAYFIFCKFIPKININNNHRDTILLGLVLILVPSFITSLSLKYQVWVLSQRSPYAFLQIFLQYFGFGMLLLSYLSYVLENAKKYTSKARQKNVVRFISIICATSIGVIYICNYNIILKKNIFDGQNNYKIFVRATVNGLLNDVPYKYSSEITNNGYITYLRDLFEKNKEGNFVFKKSYESENNIMTNMPSLIVSQNLTYWYPSHVNIAFIDRNSIRVLNSINERQNFYYIENGYSDANVRKIKVPNNSLEGFVIAGKVNSVNYKCQKVNSQKNNSPENKNPKESDKNILEDKCEFMFNLFSPRIFIDKEYLFDLENIVSKLNQRFGENIFNVSIAKLREDISNSKDGVVLKLDQRVYRLNRH